jgi:hypothetical protein
MRLNFSLLYVLYVLCISQGREPEPLTAGVREDPGSGPVFPVQQVSWTLCPAGGNELATIRTVWEKVDGTSLGVLLLTPDFHSPALLSETSTTHSKNLWVLGPENKSVSAIPELYL